MKRGCMKALEFGAGTNTDSVWMTSGELVQGGEEAADNFCERMAPAVHSGQRARCDACRGTDELVAHRHQLRLYTARLLVLARARIDA